MQNVSGPLRRELLRQQESLHAVGESLRVPLWLVHQRFNIESAQVSKVEISLVTLGGYLELYLGCLDAILIMFWKDPDLLLALAEPQLWKAKRLTHEYAFHHRVEPDTPEKSFSTKAWRAVQRRRYALNRDALTITPKEASIQDRGKEKSKSQRQGQSTCSSI